MSAEMDRIEARAHEQLRVMRRTSAELDDVRVAVSSPDGAIRVELDGVCALVGLTLTPAACRSDGADLGRRIVDVCAVAAREVQARRAAVMERFHADFAVG
ncbi:YbaB/EbfC family nucleoid-associated protein [Tsukamurella asaccharolytica]|uniref:YbaB/EbfC family nucleoid-associated protein n=1 Tax=Tsukamurella asaccharolytica TaxID=2592067 RepID=A0A5C5RA32_9ACTN|nr:YbaB/EbfC family nucleoid-associated protein [Tsukamurella asaccharolytica]TWS19153.1 YbaB/EbfC family nucleoid-associated protein [Tsukamurella asaccharolytica]